MTTSVVASPTSAPAKAPSAPASAPAAAPSSAPATPTQGAAKPTPAPSKPQNVVKNSIGRVDRRGANDPMKAALERAKAAPAPQFETTGDGGNEPVAATPAQPTPQVSPADRAKAALSTTGKPGEQPPAQPTGEAAPTNPQSQAPDPARELESLRRSNSDFGRKLQNMNQELAEHRERKATADKEAEAAKLKPYMSGHPEHQASIGRMAKADAFDAALRSATAEQQSDPAYRSKLAREMKVTNADITLRDDWNAHREDHQSRMASDPDYFRKEVDKHSEAAAERVWERKSQEQRIRQDVTRDLADPEVRSFAKANPADFQRVLEGRGTIRSGQRTISSCSPRITHSRPALRNLNHVSETRTRKPAWLRNSNAC